MDRRRSGRREAGGWRREEAGRAFDLAQGPLLRVKLLRLGEQEHVLLVTHAPHRERRLVDGSAGAGVDGAVSRAYVRRERSRPLEELRIQYADYAVWQREWLRGRGAGGAAGVLEGAAGGVAGAGAADGSSAAGGAGAIAGARRDCGWSWRRS